MILSEWHESPCELSLAGKKLVERSLLDVVERVRVCWNASF